MSIDSKIAEILEESKLAGLIIEDQEDEIVEDESSEEEVPVVEESVDLDEEVETIKHPVSQGRPKGIGWTLHKSGEQTGKDHNVWKRTVKKVASPSFNKEEVQVDVSEDVNALLNGETLSEEFKTKAATIFEAAVVTRVKEEMTRLEEEFDAKLAQQVSAIEEGLTDKIDGYLDYIVEQWIEHNEIALESGIKSEIMESFISGMKGLFQEHYIEIPDEKYDVIGEMENKIDDLENKLNEQVSKNIDLKKSLQEASRKEIITMIGEGLVATDLEKFTSLVEELSFEDEDSFQLKVQTIRENYFTSKKHTIVESVVSDTPVMEQLTETTQHIDPAVAAYVNALKSLNQ